MLKKTWRAREHLNWTNNPDLELIISLHSGLFSQGFSNDMSDQTKRNGCLQNLYTFSEYLTFWKTLNGIIYDLNWTYVELLKDLQKEMEIALVVWNYRTIVLLSEILVFLLSSTIEVIETRKKGKLLLCLDFWTFTMFMRKSFIRI